MPTSHGRSVAAKSRTLMILSLLAFSTTAVGIDMDQRFQSDRRASWVEFSVDAPDGRIQTKGWFTKFSSTLFFDAERVERSSATFSLDADSVTLGNGLLDAPLKGLLDTANHPRIVFQSRGVARRDDGLDVSGDLTIKGTTRPVTLRLELPSEVWRNDESALDLVKLRGSLDLDRREFIPGVPQVGHRVAVAFQVTASRYTREYLARSFSAPHPVGTLYDLACHQGVDAALTAYEDLKTKTPDTIDRNTLADLGWRLMRTGHAGEAVTVYQRAIEDYPEYYNTVLRMGDAYVIAGRIPEAIDTFTSMKEHFPHSTHIAELLKQLQH